MGDLIEFAGVVGVVLVAAMGWRWGTFWIDRIRGETSAELDALEERIEELEAELGRRDALPPGGPRAESGRGPADP